MTAFIAAFNNVGFAVLGLALVVLGIVARRRFLALAGFALPLMTPGLSAGVNLFWYLLIGPLALALALLAGRSRRRDEVRGPGLFIAYVLAVSTVWAVLEYVVLQRYHLAARIGLGPAQTVLKMPVQTASFVFQVLAFYVVPMRLRAAGDAKAAIDGVLVALLASIGAGLLLVALTGTGMVGAPGRAIMQLGGQRVARIGGLSGEPKMLGAFLVVALSYTLSALATRADSPRRLRRYAAASAIFVVGLYLTFSTSAWIGFAASLGVLAVLHLFSRQRRRLGYLAAFVLAMGAAAAAVPSMRLALDERIDKRVFEDRSEEISRSKDNYVLDVFGEKPWALPFGFGMGGTDLEATPLMLHDPRYVAQRQYVRTPTPSTNIARLAGDLGIAGLLVLVSMVWRWHRFLLRRGQRRGSWFVLSGFAGLMCVSMNAVALYFFIAGALVANVANAE